MPIALFLSLLVFFLPTTANAASYHQVHDVVFGPPPTPQNEIEAEEQAVYAQGLLPHYEVRVSNFIIDGINYLRRDSKRTIADHADVLPRVEKRVHSNGICFAGDWQITATTPYTGMFRTGASGRIIARASTALSDTERGTPRAFGLAGKLFADNDPDADTPTANFFLVDVLMGAQRKHYLDVGMTNKPATGFRLSGILVSLVTAASLATADRNPGFRPLYPIAELGLSDPADAVTPRYMMVRGSADNARNEQVDFRDELNLALNGYDALAFDILVNNASANQSDKRWKTIGKITLNESIVSYGCDRQLHFSHPKVK